MKCLKVDLEMLEIIYHQKEIIDKQSEVIAKLVNQNTEQESLINELMKSEL